MDYIKTILVEQEQISPDYYEMILRWDSDQEPLPGHFFTLRGWDSTDPLLRRPFAFSDFNKEKQEASFIYQKRGPATTLMTKMEKGCELDLLGPLGSTFPEAGVRPWLLGGGIGTGPMVFLANRLAEQNRKPLLVLGFRSAKWIPKLNLHENVNLQICTDDGSQGFHGYGLQYLKSLSEIPTEIYGCGPHVMLHAAHDLAVELDRPCYVSMEERMACGVGACQGCAIEVNLPEGFLRVCKEGPVFDSRIIKWI